MQLSPKQAHDEARSIVMVESPTSYNKGLHSFPIGKGQWNFWTYYFVIIKAWGQRNVDELKAMFSSMIVTHAFKRPNAVKTLLLTNLF